jgi:hypothetical protein
MEDNLLYGVRMALLLWSGLRLVRVQRFFVEIEK